MKTTTVARPIKTRQLGEVDIVIPYHGNYQMVTRLLVSIFRHTPQYKCNAIMVDDGSPNVQYGESLSKLPKVTCVRNDKVQGFGAALAKGFEKTTRELVVFLNSDCVITDANWLKAMHETLARLRDKKVKLVVPRTNNAVGGDARQEGERSQIVEDVIVNDGFVSLYCFMCHRQLFDKVGGFIRPYPYGLYEDEEFSYRMRHYGYLQAISGAAWVEHEGEATIKDICRLNPKVYETMQANRELCLADLRSLRQKSRPVA